MKKLPLTVVLAAMQKFSTRMLKAMTRMHGEQAEQECNEAREELRAVIGDFVDFDA